MKLIKRADKTLRIKIEDADHYEVTDDNGVNFWPTPKQLKQIANAAYRLDNTVLL
jgi:hypothetical protein